LPGAITVIWAAEIALPVDAQRDLAAVQHPVAP